MKRLFLLPFLFLLVLHCSTTFAAEKWFLLYQDNEVRSFLNTENCTADIDMVFSMDCWVKNEGHDGTELVHMIIAEYDDGSFEFRIAEVRVYDKNGNYKGGEKSSNPENWQTPPPGSSTEKLIQKAIRWGYEHLSR